MLSQISSQYILLVQVKNLQFDPTQQRFAACMSNKPSDVQAQNFLNNYRNFPVGGLPAYDYTAFVAQKNYYYFSMPLQSIVSAQTPCVYVAMSELNGNMPEPLTYELEITIATAK